MYCENYNQVTYKNALALYYYNILHITYYKLYIRYLVLLYKLVCVRRVITSLAVQECHIKVSMGLKGK